MREPVVIVDSSFPQVISQIARNAEIELLVASPWMTTAGAKTLASGFNSSKSIALQIIARLDEADFLCGASHIGAFSPATYPPFVSLKVRALSLLHAKMIIADRRVVLIGSANMTEGGLWRNREVSVLLDSSEIGELCAASFFGLWEMAEDIEPDFLNSVEKLLQESLPACDDNPNKPTIQSPLHRPKHALKRRRYIIPKKARESALFLSELLSSSPVVVGVPEVKEDALDWLERKLQFLPHEVKVESENLQRLERLMYHPDPSVRATAVDRAGRTGAFIFVRRLGTLLTNRGEDPTVRSAAAFSLGLLGSAEAFSALCTALDAGNDIGRWARRSCFLLLQDLDPESRTWFLNESNVDDTVFAMQIAGECDISRGTVSERLTKALIVEMLSTNMWNSSDLELLVYSMLLVSTKIPKRGKLNSLSRVTLTVSELLRVMPGDLRHGPFSPSLLRKYQEEQNFEPGLEFLIRSASPKTSISNRPVGGDVRCQTVYDELTGY